jgi:hypothetical protein
VADGWKMVRFFCGSVPNADGFSKEVVRGRTRPKRTRVP